LDSFKAELSSTLNCHRTGRIVSFNATNQTASVEITALAQVNGAQIAYPVLTDCPVVVLNGGGATLEFPITAGDTCLVLFNDTDLDKWYTTGNTVVPNTPRTHSLSDGLVLVGVRNLSNPIASYSGTKFRIRYKGALVEIDTGGNMLLQTPSGASLTALSADGGKVQLTGKVRIANSDTNLLVVLNDLIETLKAWVNTGGSVPNAATITALNNVKTEVSQLLV
jgi:hypothetical protein